MQIGAPVPSVQRAHHDELVVALEVVVDGRRFQADHVLQLRMARYVEGVELADHMLVHRVVEVLLLFYVAHVLHLKVGEEVFAQLVDMRRVFLDVVNHAHQDEAFQVLTVFQGVFLRQQSAPGMAQQIEVFKSHLLTDFLKLAEIVVKGQKVAVFLFAEVGLVRVIRSELVIHVDLNAHVIEVGCEVLEALVCSAGAAVDAQQFDWALAHLA